MQDRITMMQEALEKWKHLAHFMKTPVDFRTGESLDALCQECIQAGEKALSGIADNKVRVVIEVNGGIVQQVYCNMQADIVVADYDDTEGADLEYLMDIPALNQQDEAYIYQGLTKAVPDPELVNAIFHQAHRD